MADQKLLVFRLPDGSGNHLFSAACDDSKASFFQCATQAAQKALDSIGRPLPIKVTSGTLGSRASSFSPVLIEAIRRADDGLNVDRHAFDLVEVTSGPMMGLQAIGIGSNKEKRERACRVAVAVAALTCPDCHSRLCSTVCSLHKLFGDKIEATMIKAGNELRANLEQHAQIATAGCAVLSVAVTNSSETKFLQCCRGSDWPPYRLY